ncbi:unnamed protein product [Owenia fusiformis]|uniref:Proline dehydrogenase n=1 Tax=Owenia fusiformis TaxID=6347 RepID=A0A8S4Q3W3_OWEFU|nr:unnamed protein product [Owenia fusiformis]
MGEENVKNLKSEQGAALDSIDLQFKDIDAAYKTKSTWEIIRALVILRTCSYNYFVDNSVKFLGLSQRFLGRSLTDFVVKPTFYGHFVAGDTPESITSTVRKLKSGGVRPMLAVPMEEDVNENIPMDEKYGRNLSAILDCILLSRHVEESRPMMQLKVTALIPADLVAKLTILYNEEKITVEEIAAYMETGALVKNECLDEEELSQLHKGLDRLAQVGKLAVEKKVRVLVDAEYTYLNPGMSLVTLAMMVLYNKQTPWIWNTYQCYLKGALSSIRAELDVTKRHNVCFGAKIVRGAYMEKEKLLALNEQREDPINPSLDATGDMYNAVVNAMLEHIKDVGTKCNIIVASSNEGAVRTTIQRLDQLGIDPGEDSVCFGQLMGMADHVSFSLGSAGFPVYKSMPYGTLEDTIPYLSRRAQENRSVLQGVRKERDLLWRELKKRVRGNTSKSMKAL